MKVQLLSDLHLEFDDYTPTQTEADVIVLAGDINLGTRAVPWIEKHWPEKPVMYVMGNHEYYKHAYPKLLDDLFSIELPNNVHILENRSVIIGSTRFLGATMWTDFNLQNNSVVDAALAQHTMNDYNQIRKSPEFRRLSAQDTVDIHSQSRKWLAHKLSEPVEGVKDFIITHHGVTPKSIDPMFAGSNSNAAYASDLEYLFLKYSPSVVVHGHTHASRQYSIGNTRVYCNPRGYSPDYVNPDFDPALLIEV